MTKTIYYVSETMFPSQRANSIQQVKMCDAFRNAGAEVCLVHPAAAVWNAGLEWSDLAEYYGLRNEFAVRSLPASKTLADHLPRADVGARAATTAGWILGRCLSGKIKSNDTVYTRNYYGILLAATLKRHLPADRQPTIAYEHHHVISAHAKQQFFDAIDRLVCITDALRRRDIKTFGIDAADCHVAPDGVSLKEYAGIDQTTARQKLELDPDRDLVVYTGHCYESKGVQDLVEAAVDIDATVLVVGGYDTDVERIKRNVGHPPNVTFTGFVEPSEIPAYQCAADVLVAPYTSDAREYISPLKLFEYMAAGKPIVASDLPVLQEVLTGGETVQFTPPEDPAALAGAISTLIEDAALANRLGDNARQDVEKYTWNRRAEGILGFLEE
jgi:glycosyltransferase involved in cell wall biosynthesis